MYGGSNYRQASGTYPSMKVLGQGHHLVWGNLGKSGTIRESNQASGVFGWLVGFVALRPKSTAMVIAGRSVHLTTLFPGQARTSG